MFCLQEFGKTFIAEGKVMKREEGGFHQEEREREDERGVRYLTFFSF